LAVREHQRATYQQGQFQLFEGVGAQQAALQQGQCFQGICTTRGQARAQKLSKWLAAQLALGGLKGLRQTAGDMPQSPVRQDFPEPVAGVFFEILEQQIHQLGLAFGLGIGTHAAQVHPRAAGDHGQHGARVNQEHRPQRGELGVIRHQEPDDAGPGDDQHMRAGRLHMGAQDEAARAQHADHHRGHQHLRMVLSPLEL